MPHVLEVNVGIFMDTRAYGGTGRVCGLGKREAGRKINGVARLNGFNLYLRLFRHNCKRGLPVP
jgi:hypothetical protein